MLQIALQFQDKMGIGLAARCSVGTSIPSILSTRVQPASSIGTNSSRVGGGNSNLTFNSQVDEPI